MPPTSVFHLTRTPLWRRLEIRCPHATHPVSPFPFCGIDTGTLVSVPGVLCCMVENYQARDVLQLPAPLWPFFPSTAGAIPLRPAKGTAKGQLREPT